MRKNTKVMFVAIAVPFLLFPKLASAQFRGDSRTTVAEIRRNPIDDMDVVLRGYIVSKIDDDEYIFSDGTGRIVVDIDDDDIEDKRIDRRTRIEIGGEVEADDRRDRNPEINVDWVRVY